MAAALVAVGESRDHGARRCGRGPVGLYGNPLGAPVLLIIDAVVPPQQIALKEMGRVSVAIYRPGCTPTN